MYKGQQFYNNTVSGFAFENIFQLVDIFHSISWLFKVLGKYELYLFISTEGSMALCRQCD